MASVESVSVEIAFGMIGAAYRCLAPTDYDGIARSLRQQIDMAYYCDPTTALRIHADGGDMDRKLKLIDAAAAFVAQVRAVEEGLPK